MATTKKKSTEVTVKNYSLDGAEKGVTEVKKELLAYKPNALLLAQYVRVYLANQREGNASTKMRSEVGGTTKKMYKQKGTGRARHGSYRAPLFKGGGIVGGPKPKEHRLTMSKTQKKLSLLSAVAQQLQGGLVMTLENAVLEVKPKTKQFASLLKAVKVGKESLLVVLPDAKAVGVVKSLRNVESVSTTYMGSLNAHDVLNADRILFVAQAFEAVQNLYTQ